jgi:hypothetical protein
MKQPFLIFGDSGDRLLPTFVGLGSAGRKKKAFPHSPQNFVLG